MLNILNSEPALVVGAVNAVVGALVIPDPWAKAIMAVVALVLSVVTRSRVSPVAAPSAGPPPAPPAA